MIEYCPKVFFHWDFLRSSPRRRRKVYFSEVFMDIFSALTDFVGGIRETLPPWARLLVTGLISMIPILELRGGVLVGVMTFGLPVIPVFLVSIVGNMIPIPFIIVFVRKVFMWLKDRAKFAAAIYRLEKRALEKAKIVYKYQLVGLFIFVAIPLPGTGAWTGALIAALLNMRLKDSVPAIFFGVVVAGILMSIFSHGAYSLITSAA